MMRKEEYCALMNGCIRNVAFKNQKIDAPPHSKECGLNGARFLDANKFHHKGICCTANCNSQQFACAQSAFIRRLKSTVFGIGTLT